MSVSSGFELFTSLRYDSKLLSEKFNTDIAGEPSPYFLMQYHAERLMSAAKAFQWAQAIQTMNSPHILETLKRLCDEAVAKAASTEKDAGLRLRILLSQAGTLRVESYPAKPLLRGAMDAAHFNPDDFKGSLDNAPQPLYLVYLDTQPTPSSQFTSYKTTTRDHYEASRSRVGLKDRNEPNEVILYNENGEITECSFRNVAFWRQGGWVAPHGSSGGVAGTVRRWLMESGLLKEAVISKDDVVFGEWVLLTNGVEITVLGKIMDV